MIHPEDHDHPDFSSSDDGPERETEVLAWIASMTPKHLLENLYRCVLNMSNALSGYKPDHLQRMLARIDEAKAVAESCGCNSCKIKVAFIVDLAPMLIAAMETVSKIKADLMPAAQANRERIARIVQAKAKLQTELAGLANGGKLGWS